jgi:hypothetical protein
VLVSSTSTLVNFCLLDYFPVIAIDLSIFPFSYIRFCLMYLNAILWGISTLRITISFLIDWPLYHYIMCVFISDHFLFYFFIHLFICAYIFLSHLSPVPSTPSLSPRTPSLPGRTCSAFISNFVEEKTKA